MDGKTSPSLHTTNFLKFSIQSILSAREREREREETAETLADKDDLQMREEGVRIARPMVTNW